MSPTTPTVPVLDSLACSRSCHRLEVRPPHTSVDLVLCRRCLCREDPSSQRLWQSMRSTGAACVIVECGATGPDRRFVSISSSKLNATLRQVECHPFRKLILMKTEAATDNNTSTKQQTVLQRMYSKGVHHTAISRSRYSPTSFQVARGLHRKTWTHSLCKMRAIRQSGNGPRPVDSGPQLTRERERKRVM